MIKQDKNSALTLEEAKEKLRNSLNRLENIVEKRIAYAKKNVPEDSSETVKKFVEIKAALEEKEKENRHLREENQQLQAEIGKLEDEISSLHEINGKAAGKVEGIIKELKVAIG